MKRRSDESSVLDFSEDWKSLFCVNSVHNAPLLLHSPSTFGPLVFNPLPETLTPLFSSPSLSPLSDLKAASRLSLSRFVSTSVNPESFLPPSLACSIANSSSPDDYCQNANWELRNNRLQLLHCPGEESAIVFFPVGENFDQVGFVKLSVEDSKLSACGNNDGVVPFVGRKKLVHRIVKMLVQPVEDSTYIGYLMALTLYSVHWFGVKLTVSGLKSEHPCLSYLGGKQFKSSSIADAAWSPHMPEESVVLLESGELFMFDLNNISKNTSQNVKFKGKRYTTLGSGLDVSEKHKWFGCEFSWHPRILVAGHQEAIFLLDLRFEKSDVICLARIEDLGLKNNFVEKHLFIALAREILDPFRFVVASNYVLAIFDIRKSRMPVLQWDHHLEEPTCVDVIRLSDLRPGIQDDSYDWATGAGSCITLGSFWHSEFMVFCYGPSKPAPSGSFASIISEVSTSIYAWELPSEIMLTSHDCPCGSCLIRDEFLKDDLPRWVAWQQKKEITLGFGIISTNMSSLLSEPYKENGFTLVRLLSSGKLEAQRYRASWEFPNVLEEFHKGHMEHAGSNVLCSAGQDSYRFPRRFKYLKLDYLNAHLNDDDSKLISNQQTPFGGHRKKDYCNMDSYKFIHEKLKAFGLGVSKSITEVLEDVSFPSSIHEVAVRRMWTTLPLNLLQLAFSNYSELLKVHLDKKKVSLEFLPVPQEPQLPPYFGRKCSRRSNKWSSKVKRSGDIVGPLLPLPVLVSLQKARAETILHGNQFDDVSYKGNVASQCCEVTKAAKELAATISSDRKSITTLDNDREDAPDCSAASIFSSTRPFFMYTRGSMAEEHPSCTDSYEQDGFESKDDRHTTYLSKLPKNESSENTKDAEREQFTDLCPVELNFRGKVVVGKESQRAFSLLKRQFSKWLEGVDSYQEFCRRPKYQKIG
ncbi:unnamed protein product [Rhodiola kirilowii]